MPRERDPDDPVFLQVRMTEGLRRKLAQAAEKNARSLNSEIVFRLGESLEEEKAEPEQLAPRPISIGRVAMAPPAAPEPDRKGEFLKLRERMEQREWVEQLVQEEVARQIAAMKKAEGDA